MAPFCSCPASLVSRKFFAVGPGCAKCFFFCCAPLGAATFRRGQSKKKTPPRVCFFLLRPRGKAGEGEAPCRHGARAKKKNTTQGVFFFAPAPGKGKGRRSPAGRRHGARAKKKNTTQGVFFFAPAPGKGRGRRSPVGRRHGARAKKKTPPRTLTHSLWAGAISARPGWCSFFCCGPAGSF